MTKPTLSVIMANYNHAQYIGEALEAVITQSFKPLEIFVIDDGSTDNSVNVIEDFIRQEPRIDFIKHEKNMGIQYNLQYFTRLPKGDYIYSAAADDKILPGFFEKSMALLSKYPQAGICCSDPVFFNNDDNTINRSMLLKNIKESYFEPDALITLFKRTPFWIAGHTCIVKTSSLIRAGGYFPKLKWYCDWFAMLVIAFREGICYIPEPLASMRVLSSSYSASGVREAKEQDEVFANLFKLLAQREYSDVSLFFKKSAVLSQLDRRILLHLLKESKHASALLILKIFKKILRDEMSSIMPRRVKQIYKKMRNTSLREEGQL